MKSKIVLTVIALGSLISFNANANPNIDLQLERLEQQGASSSDSSRGKQLWYSKNGDRSCTSCHGKSAVAVGKHIKTGKEISPMAASANADRFGDSKKVKKWFLRNCKWTLGRECSVQEKSDILFWLNSQ